MDSGISGGGQDTRVTRRFIMWLIKHEGERFEKQSTSFICLPGQGQTRGITQSVEKYRPMTPVTPRGRKAEGACDWWLNGLGPDSGIAVRQSGRTQKARRPECRSGGGASGGKGRAGRGISGGEEEGHRILEGFSHDERAAPGGKLGNKGAQNVWCGSGKRRRIAGSKQNRRVHAGEERGRGQETEDTTVWGEN
ncbi:hypothetical protein HNY73_019573 [Argiope bruennichi]|uniref:Uncharacterized protein n=1 Tax=Argiope bruennichi TaxID=94029 RepID=A0A8T0E3Q3_ARGBR|nr:hypothetical protein HNY73_019573 [Argiope bruennichi]